MRNKLESLQDEHAKGIADSIKHFYDRSQLVTMPIPCTDQQQAKLKTLPLNDLQEEFISKLYVLKDTIISVAAPKTVRNIPFTGASMAQMIQFYVEQLNSTSIPNIDNAFTKLIDAEKNKLKKCFDSLVEMTLVTKIQLPMDEIVMFEAFQDLLIKISDIISINSVFDSKTKIEMHTKYKSEVDKLNSKYKLNNINSSTKMCNLAKDKALSKIKSLCAETETQNCIKDVDIEEIMISLREDVDKTMNNLCELD